MASNEQIRRVEVDLRTLPSYSELNDQIKKLTRESTWWELYGVDWMHVAASAIFVGASLVLFKYESIPCQIAAAVLLGCAHGIIANKTGHLAAHGAMAESKKVNKFFTKFFVEFMGSFSSWCGNDIHIKVHHPHTNIIGLGDSSTWRVPFLSTIPYMFFMPLIIPTITPFVSVLLLVQEKQWKELLKYMVVMPLGLALHVFLLMSISGFTFSGAILCLAVSRAVLAIPYIHINIFQHIGLPMYDKKHRPKRIYQMSTGCLNLSRNWFLDFTFGHSLVNCHIEHHLFPQLSDNMCLKAKPIVRKYLQENGLPYQEDSYSNRLSLFLSQYSTLMVNMPPVTHFVGIQ